MNRLWLLVAVVAVSLAGCADTSSNLSEDKDKAVRDNMTRALTPEEVAQMKGGAGAEGGPGGAMPPPKKGNQGP